MDSLAYAIDTINSAYKNILDLDQDCLVCQLVNSNKGFSSDTIEALKSYLRDKVFTVPTYISILPKGKKTSTFKMFDGLEEIYCNSEDLRRQINRMKQTNIK